MLRFELTNVKHTYKRVYLTVMDALVQIGGLGEIIIFTFMMLMTLHSSIVREMYLLNVCIIENNQYSRKSTIRHNQVADVRARPEDIAIDKFSYFEIVCFKSLGFLKRKNPRYI